MIQHTESEAVRESPFAQFHRPVICDLGLPDAAFRLYAVLSGHADETGWCRLRRRTIATETGWSLDKVDRQTVVLTNAGHLMVVRGKSDLGDPDVNTYQLTYRAPVKRLGSRIRAGRVAASVRLPIKNEPLVNQSPHTPRGDDVVTGNPCPTTPGALVGFLSRDEQDARYYAERAEREVSADGPPRPSRSGRSRS